MGVEQDWVAPEVGTAAALLSSSVSFFLTVVEEPVAEVGVETAVGRSSEAGGEGAIPVVVDARRSELLLPSSVVVAANSAPARPGVSEADTQLAAKKLAADIQIKYLPERVSAMTYPRRPLAQRLAWTELRRTELAATLRAALRPSDGTVQA